MKHKYFRSHVERNAAKSKLKSGSIAVAHTVRDYIIANGFKAGDTLPSQDQLSKILGIGIRRLREGLSILAHQGLIKMNGKGGTRVMEASIKAVHDSINWYLSRKGFTKEELIRARARIESATAAEAAKARKAKDLLTILEVLERMEERFAAKKSYNEIDQQLHLAILAATHNPVLQVFGDLISAQFWSKVRTSANTPRKVQQLGLREHRAIYDALKDGDDQLVSALIYEHITLQIKRG